MRLLASLSNYVATQNERGIQIHQYSNMEISTPYASLTVETDYPWDGRVKIALTESRAEPWTLALRVPGWCQSFEVNLNGQSVNSSLQKGYVTIEHMWKTGDAIEIDFPMTAFLVEADPRVDSVRGCVAIQRGPVVYCIEEHDQEPGANLLDIKIDPSGEFSSRWQGDLLGGVVTLEGTGYQMDRSAWSNNRLYRPLVPGNENHTLDRRVKLTAIPYYAWGNRGLKSMRVWIPLAMVE